MAGGVYSDRGGDTAYRTTVPKKKTTTNLYNPVANQNKPGTNPRVDYLYETFGKDYANAPGYLKGRMADELWNGYVGAQPATNLNLPQQQRYGSGGYGGGGGGGAAGGLDQATLDWILGQLGRGRPQALTANTLDLPDPSQYYGQFNAQPYDQAAQGVTSGINAMRTRGNEAIDFALGEIGRYQNPYSAGVQQRMPDLYGAFGGMAAANDAMGALHGAVGEGAQADQAMRNAYALMAANDASRNAANVRGLEGDRRTMETNLGLEGNLLGLGVNMAKSKASSAWDQMIREAQYQAAQTEAAQNWQRGNTVADTNVANNNAWNQGLMQTLLSIIGAKAPGTTLPADTNMYYAV